MDGKQFDVLTRSIAQRLSRRLTFKAMTAGLAAGALGQLDAEPVDAARCQSLGKSCKRRRGRPRPKCCAGSVCRGNTCQCKPNRQKCGNKCITRKQCCRNNDCPNNQRCDKKTNKCGCGKNQRRCQGTCISNSLCCNDADCQGDMVCNPEGQCVARECADDNDCASGTCTCKPASWPNIDFGTCQANSYSNNFSSNLAGWYDFQDRDENTPDNTWLNELYPPDTSIELDTGEAIVQARNAYAPDFERTAMSLLGGFSDTFPLGGYDVAIDIYLDPADIDEIRRFGYTSAINQPDCSHESDFGFEVGTNGVDALCVAAQQGISPNTGLDVCAMTGAVDLTAAGVTAGWYTFRHEFRDNAGSLEVTMTITPQGGGDAVFTATLPGNSPIQIDDVGGNRYAWFAFNSFPEGVRIDNIRREEV